MVQLDKVIVLSEFCKNHSYIVDRMRNTLHTSNESLNINPYHIEGDVWSHTLLVLQQLDETKFELSNISHRPSIMSHACLLHDVGKIFTQATYGLKTSFKNHGPAGVQFAIDYFYNCTNEDTISLYYLLNIVSNHIDCFKCKKEDIKLLINNDPNLYHHMKCFVEADTKGRFHIDDEQIPFLQEYVTFDKDLEINEQFDVYIMCGVPGSGKDYVASKLGHKIISYDDIRLEIYNKSRTLCIDKFDQKTRYNNAFEYCKKRTNLLSNLLTITQEYINNKTPIIISNTSLETNTRVDLVRKIRRLSNDPIKIACIFVANTRENCINNDLKRLDKTVGECVINRFCTSIQIPTMLEGFNKIFINSNNYRID